MFKITKLLNDLKKKTVNKTNERAAAHNVAEAAPPAPPLHLDDDVRPLHVPGRTIRHRYRISD